MASTTRTILSLLLRMRSLRTPQPYQNEGKKELMGEDASPIPRAAPPGLGVEVDETGLARYHQDSLDLGDFPPYGDKFGKAG